MNLNRAISSRGVSTGLRKGFTLVELSLCIAVVAVAIVAIVGVLPLGINVQKENREQTIINADATVLIEALRNASSGVRYLTNHFDYVRVDSFGGGVNESSIYLGTRYNLADSLPGFDPGAIPGVEVFRGVAGLSSCTNIIGLLGTPKILGSRRPNEWITNRVTSVVRAFGGSASEKPSVNSNENPAEGVLDTSFKYRLTAEVSGHSASPTNLVALTPEHREHYRQMQANLHDVTLTFEWPVYVVKNEVRVGNFKAVYRTQVAATLQPAPQLTHRSWPLSLWFFQPQRLAAVQR